jgi:uncharacterized protein YndB with AHSA1/START domain
MHAIKHLFHINAKRAEVYNALASIEKIQQWWTVQTTGNASPGGIIQFRFGNYGGPDMKVLESVPGEKVVWECVSDPHWMGHILSFQLDENEGKTRVRFSHEGWKEQNDFYAVCSFSWALYLQSLRQLCQTGKGEAFGSENYKR